MVIDLFCFSTDYLMSKTRYNDMDLSINLLMLIWILRPSLSHKHLRGDVCWSKHGEGSCIFINEVNTWIHYDILPMLNSNFENTCFILHDLVAYIFDDRLIMACLRACYMKMMSTFFMTWKNASTKVLTSKWTNEIDFWQWYSKRCWLIFFYLSLLTCTC